MPVTVSRRAFLKVAALSGAGAALAACAPAAAPAPAPQPPAAEQPAEQTSTEAPAAPAASSAPVELKVLAENWGEVYNELMSVIGDEYTKENPNVTVTWEFDPEWRTKLTTLLAANTPPDLAFMRGDFLAAVAPKGVLLALDDYLAEANVKRDDFVLPLYDSGSYQGKLYAIPGGADVWSLFYNKGLYEASGLPSDKAPATIPEFADNSEKLLKKSDDGTIEQASLWYTTGWLPQWMYAFGGKLYDDASGKVTANDPKNVEAFTFLKGFWQGMGDIDQLTAFAQRPGQLEAGNPFATGQSVHVFDGFWYYEAIDQYAPDMQYGVGYWPTPNGTEEEKKNWMLDGWQYSLPKGIPNVDESWKFMRYMFVDNSAKMGCDTLNGPCIVAQFQDWITCLQQKMGPDNRMAPYLKIFTEQAQVATKYLARHRESGVLC